MKPINRAHLRAALNRLHRKRNQQKKLILSAEAHFSLPRLDALMALLAG